MREGQYANSERSETIHTSNTLTVHTVRSFFFQFSLSAGLPPTSPTSSLSVPLQPVCFPLSLFSLAFFILPNPFLPSFPFFFSFRPRSFLPSFVPVLFDIVSFSCFHTIVIV